MPIHVKQYRYAFVHKKEIEDQISDLYNSGIIRDSNSAYNSKLWIVPKKADSQGNKKWRMVIDYKKLNEKTVRDAYPLVNITDILDQLRGAKYFSTFDLAKGFHHIPLDPESIPKSVFSGPFGHYEYTRMPFGLKTLQNTFQRLMDQVLSGLQGTELFEYMDIIIYASSIEEHTRKLKSLLGRLKTAGLALQPDKCHFLRREITYLGYVISENGVKPGPKNIIAVKEFPVPKTRKNMKQFLGLVGYYRRFIPEFARIAKPLTRLLKKRPHFNGVILNKRLLKFLVIKFRQNQYCNIQTSQNLLFSQQMLLNSH